MTTLTPDILQKAARRIGAKPWRVVEAQHRASTMRLVDTLDEQRTLEDLIEASKPPLPVGAAHLHYLLATPFRYPAPPPSGSRFRGIGDPGVWYGAAAVHTALAEVAYWRLRFLADSPATPDLPPVPHTAFRASVGGSAIVLGDPPFTRQRHLWEDPASYEATQALARVARDAGIALIRYRSVRDPEHRACVAVLTPKAFRRTAPLEQHAWLIKVTRARVLAETDLGTQRIAFEPAALGLPAMALERK
ncbi:RES family NAD+ phosphorylase [Dokdonella soli]|uniref:RES family NAD+ phosphorylase n=1 Tax=Dokdonella soli TaxID=529810 RepID=A0ABP3TLL2_9GAMM